MHQVIIIILTIFLSFNTCQANEDNHKHSPNEVFRNEVIKHDHSHEHGALSFLDEVEEKIEHEISEVTHKIKETKSPKLILLGILLSLLFGIFHALGPGYGKSVIFSYFLSQKEDIWKVPIMSSQIAATHILSGIVIVWLANISIKNILPSTEVQILWLKLISYSLITLIGIYMVINKIKNSKCSCCSHSSIKSKSLAISTGLIPCPGTMLILLFAMANNILWLGIILIIFKGIGIAITLTAVGLIGVYANKKVGDLSIPWAKPIEYLGPIFITFIGIFMLTATIL